MRQRFVKNPSLPFRRFARTLVELVLRRLEQKKQAGGGDFALIVVVVNFVAKVLRTSYGSGGDLSGHSIRELD